MECASHQTVCFTLFIRLSWANNWTQVKTLIKRRERQTDRQRQRDTERHTEKEGGEGIQYFGDNQIKI